MRHRLVGVDSQFVRIALRPLADQLQPRFNPHTAISRLKRRIVAYLNAFISHRVAAKFARVRGLRECLITITVLR